MEIKEGSSKDTFNTMYREITIAFRNHQSWPRYTKIYPWSWMNLNTLALVHNN